MRAIVSGRMGAALVIDGEQMYSLHVDSPDIAVLRNPGDIPHILGDAADLEFFEEVSPLAVRDAMLTAAVREESLSLILIGLDDTLAEETRLEAISALDTLLIGDDQADTDITPELSSTAWTHVRYVLYARPLPKTADMAGLQRICKTISASSVLSLVDELEAAQEAIQDVDLAWESVPEVAFGEFGRDCERNRLVREGGFYRLVRSLVECGALSDVELAQVDTSVGKEWLTRLRAVRKLRMGPDRNDLVVKSYPDPPFASVIGNRVFRWPRNSSPSLPSMSRIKIAFCVADPHFAPPAERVGRLLLDEDVRQIREKVRAAEHRDTLEFDVRWAARPDDLIRAFNETRPQVVHFSGHGRDDGLVLVGADERSPHSVDDAALARLFEVFRGDIRVVVLNACFSLPQAQAIAGAVGCAIGTRGEISDAAAITFGASFYRAIAFGQSVQAAYDQACVALALEHFEDRECPQLVARPDIDPARLVLVSPTPKLPRAPGWTRRAVITSAAIAATAVGSVYLAPERSQQSRVPAVFSVPDTAAAQAAPLPAVGFLVPVVPVLTALAAYFAVDSVYSPPLPDDLIDFVHRPPLPNVLIDSVYRPPLSNVLIDSVYRPPLLDDSGNTVRNGGFQDRFAEWTRSVDGAWGKGTNEIVSFAGARSGYALHLTYEGRGGLLFAQKVPVAGPDHVFRATFRASSHEGPMIGFSGTGIATVMLQYLDADGRFLGMTSFYNYVKNPFADTPLVGVPRRGNGGNDIHYIDVERERLYKDVEIDIRREIEENLVGVAAEQVRTVAIVLYCGATDDGAGAELLVSDLSLRPRR